MKLKDAELARKLVDYVGPTLVALAAGSSTRRAAELWCSNNSHHPMTGQERQRLELALECLETVEEHEGTDTARAWFTRANVGDDFATQISPAEALCEGRLEDVRLSMKRFIDPEQMGK